MTCFRLSHSSVIVALALVKIRHSLCWSQLIWHVHQFCVTSSLHHGAHTHCVSAPLQSPTISQSHLDDTFFEQLSTSSTLDEHYTRRANNPHPLSTQRNAANFGVDSRMSFIENCDWVDFKWSTVARCCCWMIDYWTMYRCRWRALIIHYERMSVKVSQLNAKRQDCVCALDGWLGMGWGGRTTTGTTLTHQRLWK